MHCVKKLSESLYWVGGSDRRLALFENVFPIPRGVSYNAYLMLDEKTVLMDTVDRSVGDVFEENVEHVLAGRPLDYVVVNHMEPDHCATLAELLRRHPETAVVGNAKTFQMIAQFFPGLDLTGRSVTVAEGGRTVGMMQSQMGFDPVVGWLACVEGPSRGKSYTIRGGINSIGRGDRMDIVITGDLKISSENHAKISYSEKNNRFNLLPGEGRNIVYLNDEEVFSPMPLKAYDLIDFGETKLVFVPLCGEQFTWKKEED